RLVLPTAVGPTRNTASGSGTDIDIMRDLEVTSRTRQQCDHIKLQRAVSVRVWVVSNEELGGIMHMNEFGRRDRLLRQAVALATARFDLYEDQYVPLLSQQVNLAMRRVQIAAQDSEPLLFQKARGRLL